MDDFIEMMLKAAIKDAEKRSNLSSDSESDDEEFAYHAKKIAKANKVLFDAHIAAGFNEEQALKLVVTAITGARR